jgi:hypothetical protein
LQILDCRLRIADLSFGLPPFGRVPSFELRIADFIKQEKGTLRLHEHKEHSITLAVSVIQLYSHSLISSYKTLSCCGVEMMRFRVRHQAESASISSRQ